MIIKCGKCETTFRFEDQLMAGDGVWVRCSRCWHVFFQDNPLPTEPASPMSENTESRDMERQEAPSDARYGAAAAVQDDAGQASGKKEEEPLPSRVKEIRDIMEAEAGTGSLRAAEFEDLEALTTEESGAGLFKEDPEPIALGKKTQSSAVGKFFAYFFLGLSLVLLLGGVSLWVFPEVRLQALNFLASYFPGVKGLGSGQRTTAPFAGKVVLQDVRQHLVHNWLLGNLWVLEGAAVNTSDYSLTNVQVRGRLYDGAGNILGERVSLCGNLLTDAELTTLTEEDIQKKLAQPQGGDPANDRLRSKAQLPFMIVLVHEQSGVAKTTAMVAGAEKLLE